nr:MAG TPA: hypothetical protein [Caudoviricetes sp.]
MLGKFSMYIYSKNIPDHDYGWYILTYGRY